jgi:hypothetical protein
MLCKTKNRGFYVVVTKINDNPEQWGWTIRRRSPPIGVKLEERGFPSHRAAVLAGRVALVDFLDSLSLEETNRA